jgi:hypothetical protein
MHLHNSYIDYWSIYLDDRRRLVAGEYSHRLATTPSGWGRGGHCKSLPLFQSSQDPALACLFHVYLRGAEKEEREEREEIKVEDVHPHWCRMLLLPNDEVHTVPVVATQNLFTKNA